MTLLLRRALVGVSPMGIGLIVVLCALNGLRRSQPWSYSGEPWVVWFAVYFGQSLTQAALIFAAVVAFFIILWSQSQLLRGIRTDERDVVPGNLRQRLRQFLQPAVVRKPSVENGGIVAEAHLESGRLR